MRSAGAEVRRGVQAALFVIAALGAATAEGADARRADELIGEWWTEGNEGRIKFVRAHDGSFTGTSTCCHPKPSSKDNPRDIHNPDPKLRERWTVGIVIIWKLTYANGEYSSGYVYNPRNGKTYRLQAKLIDHNTLKIRGYLGIPLLGESQLWKRALPKRG